MVLSSVDGLSYNLAFFRTLHVIYVNVCIIISLLPPPPSTASVPHVSPPSSTDPQPHPPTPSSEFKSLLLLFCSYTTCPWLVGKACSHRRLHTTYTMYSICDHYTCVYTLFVFTGIPTGRLEEVISDEDVATIARKHLTDWESLRPYLGLSRVQKEDIRKTYSDYAKQKCECLEVWQETKGNEATYGALITAAEKAEDKKLADSVRAMLAAKAPPT